MSSKKMIVVAVLVMAMMALSSCGQSRVRISRDSLYVNDIILPLRHGYRFAEDCYSIVETESGYDVIIHAERVPEEQQ